MSGKLSRKPSFYSFFIRWGFLCWPNIRLVPTVKHFFFKLKLVCSLACIASSPVVLWADSPWVLHFSVSHTENGESRRRPNVTGDSAFYICSSFTLNILTCLTSHTHLCLLVIGPIFYYLLLPCEPQRHSTEMETHISNAKQLICILDKTRLLSYSQKKNKLMGANTRTNFASCDSRYFFYFFSLSFICFPRNNTC